MPSTYEPIATTTLGSNQTEITFSSIPQTYTDLVLIVAGTATTGGASFYCRVNGDSSSKYCWAYLSSNGTTVSGSTLSESSAGGNGLGLGGFQGYSTDQFRIVANFNNYSNTSVLKNCQSLGVQAKGSSTPTAEYILSYYNSTSAITSLTLRINAAYFYEASTTATLFGILKA